MPNVGDYFNLHVEIERSYLLQKISDSLAVRALEATGFEEAHDMLTRSLVHNLAFGQEDDVVEQVEGFGCGL